MQPHAPVGMRGGVQLCPEAAGPRNRGRHAGLPLLWLHYLIKDHKSAPLFFRITPTAPNTARVHSHSTGAGPRVIADLICAHVSIDHDSAVFLPDPKFILQLTRIGLEPYFSVRKETKALGFFIVEHFPFKSILAISPQFARF